VPSVGLDADGVADVSATLVDQSEGLSALVPSADVEPPTATWRSTKPHQAEVVRLYATGRSLTSISKDVGIVGDG
jgi:hypothetical protein